MRHYVDLKENYEDVLLFYRLGDFYELFFSDAEIASHELELTLTGRNAGIDKKIPMCGVPHHAVETYIDKLVKKGYKVAICEQVEDPKTAKGIVKREVQEVISLGTIISSNSLNEKENNYIASIEDFEYYYIITYCDITTGQLYTEKLIYDNNSNSFSFYVYRHTDFFVKLYGTDVTLNHDSETGMVIHQNVSAIWENRYGASQEINRDDANTNTDIGGSLSLEETIRQHIGTLSDQTLNQYVLLDHVTQSIVGYFDDTNNFIFRPFK